MTLSNLRCSFSKTQAVMCGKPGCKWKMMKKKLGRRCWGRAVLIIGEEVLGESSFNNWGGGVGGEQF